MSITENAAIKAVRDGLEGRNVPIVHEEIRVVLAMALERDALRARVAELERERDAAKADAARLREALERYGDHHPCCDYAERALYEDCACGFRDALASAPSAEPEGPDYSGLCSAPECGGHCGYVHAVGCEAIREYLAEHGGAPYKAPARTAHLAPSAPTPRDMRVAEAVYFDALSEACADIDLVGVAAYGELQNFARDLDAISSADNRHVRRIANQLRERLERIDAALASAPSAEPTPRDMRIAEAWEAFQPHLDAAEEALARGIQWDGDTMQVLYEARAVVAKAVGT
ncbi:MAG: hypothetical protein IPQ23_22350 [Cytophagaceae bacterium]|nr:hypothetical protein [Cytophagaceae bacterium]